MSNSQLQELKVLLKEKKTDLMKATNSTDITIGLKETGGKLTDKWCFRVWVRKKIPIEDIPDAQLVPSKISGVETDVVTDEEFKAQDEAPDLGNAMNDGITRLRPIPMGCSICNVRGTAGTTGYLYRIGHTFYILSNAHVLAANPFVGISDQETRTVQPGPHHGGSLNGDHCGSMTKMLQLNDHSQGVAIRLESETGTKDDGTTIQASYNTADAALCEHIVDAVPDIVDLPGMPVLSEGEALPGDIVVSSSWRMGGVTKAIVTDVGKMGRVSYGGGKIALIADCIVVKKYGDPGTSGMGANRESDGAALGLNFAGSATLNLICTIQNINKVFGGQVVCTGGQPPEEDTVINLGPITMEPEEGNGGDPQEYTIVGGPVTDEKTGDIIKPTIILDHPTDGSIIPKWTGDIFKFTGISHSETDALLTLTHKGCTDKEIQITFPAQP